MIVPSSNPLIFRKSLYQIYDYMKLFVPGNLMGGIFIVFFRMGVLNADLRYERKNPGFEPGNLE